MRIDDRLIGASSPNQGLTSIRSLVCLGDSWTDDYWWSVPQGFYAKRPNPFGHWTHIIQREMKIPVVNKGITGDKAENIAVGTNTRMGEVLDLKPSHVTVMIGGNDMYNKATCDQMMYWIDIICETMRVNGIKVILMWYPISAGGEPPGNPPIDIQWQRIIEMRTRTKNYAMLKGHTHVDFFDCTMYAGGNTPNLKYYLPDGIHANALGMPIIAEHLMSIINKGGI